MKINSLTLNNFRGIKDKKIALDSKNTSIYGANGTGKTTIANAISYLLTDAPATGEKDFSPKTEGTHNLNHTAEMELIANNGVIMSIGKDFHEVWKKKRGSQSPEFSGHETDYFINSVPVKKKEYDAEINGLCGGDAKKVLMLSKVGYFAEDMPMDERRRILFDVCGDVTDDEVMESAGLMELKSVLKMPGVSGNSYTVDEYLQIAKVRRRDLNKKLDELPARIDEAKRALPEDGQEIAEGWIAKAKGDISQLEAEKARMLTPAAPDTKVEGLKAAIAGMKAGIEKGRQSFLEALNARNAEYYKQIDGFRKELRKVEDDLRDTTRRRQETQQQIDSMNANRARLLQEFDQLKNTRWDAGKEICPTCGQKLPADAVEKLRENFLQGLANEKARINAEGKACSKQAIADTEDKITALLDKENTLQGQIDKLTAKIEAEPPATDGNITDYEQTSEYKEYSKKLTELNAQYEYEKLQKEWHAPDTSEIDKKIEDWHQKVAAYNAATTAKERIAELESEQQTTGAALDNIDRNIAMCEDFFRAKVNLVSKNVEKHFHNIAFLLFKEQINGGLKEVCEPLVPDKDGNLVEYKSANTAAQVNAGLEIIKVLSDHYKIYLPVIVDRAESVTDLMPMPDHQIIRLIVSAEDKKLRVEKE